MTVAPTAPRRTLRDLLPPRMRAQYTDNVLDDRAVRLLAIRVPDAYPPDAAKRLGTSLSVWLPRMTRDSQRSASARKMAASLAGPQSPRPIAGQEYEAAGPWRKAAMRAADTFLRAMPSTASTAPPMVVPPASTVGEHAVELGAGAAGFMGTAAASTAALAPVLGPAAPLAGLAAAGALPAGTAKERVIRGSTTAAAGAIASGLGGLAARRMTAQAGRSMARAAVRGPGAAPRRNVAQAVAQGLVAKAAPPAATAVSFGALQPNLEAAAHKATGDEAEFLNPMEMAQGTANMVALEIAMGVLRKVPALRGRIGFRERGEQRQAPADPEPQRALTGPPGPAGLLEAPPKTRPMQQTAPRPPAGLLPGPRSSEMPVGVGRGVPPVAPRQRALPAPAPAPRPEALARIEAAVKEPPLPPGAKKMRGAAIAGQRQLNEMMAGREFMLRLPEGEARIGVLQAFYYPYPRVPNPLRLLVYDTTKPGDIDVLAFSSLGELKESLVSADTAVPRESAALSPILPNATRIRALERNIAQNPSSPKVKKWKQKLAALRGEPGATSPAAPPALRPAAAKKPVAEGTRGAAPIPAAAAAAPKPVAASSPTPTENEARPASRAAASAGAAPIVSAPPQPAPQQARAEGEASKPQVREGKVRTEESTAPTPQNKEEVDDYSIETVLNQVNTEPGDATLVRDQPGFERALEADGWTRGMRGKGEVWRKGGRELFIRGQGERSMPIVQWNDAPDGEGGPSDKAQVGPHAAERPVRPGGSGEQRDADGQRNIGRSEGAAAPEAAPGEWRPTLTEARSEHSQAADESVIPEHFKDKLYPHQRQAVAKMISAMENNGGGLLASGTGAGKTRIQLVVAEHFRKQGNAVVIVSPSEVIKQDWDKRTYRGDYAKSGEVLGVKPVLWNGKYGEAVEGGKIYLTTLEQVHNLAPDANTVLILDESHKFKNPGSQRTKKMLRMLESARAVLYASATPKDTIGNFRYLARSGILEGGTYKDMLDGLGLHLSESKKKVWLQPGEMPVVGEEVVFDPGPDSRLRYKLTGTVEKVSGSDIEIKGRSRTFTVARESGDIARFEVGESVTPKHGVSAEEIESNVERLFDRMVAAGRMVRHEISLAGVPIEHITLPVPAELAGAMERLESLMSEGRGADNLSDLEKARVKMALRRHLEHLKAEKGLELVRREIARGRQVVVFVSRVNESTPNRREWQYNPETGKHESVMVPIEEFKSPGTIGLMKSALEADGLSVGEIHGGVSKKKQLASMDRFQDGADAVVLATPESGGTGIDLDQQRPGAKPRTLIIMTSPFDAMGYTQAVGRVLRSTTLEMPHIATVYFDHHIDTWNRKIIEKKLRDLGATVQGEIKSLQGGSAGASLLDPVAPAPAKDAKGELVHRVEGGFSKHRQRHVRERRLADPGSGTPSTEPGPRNYQPGEKVSIGNGVKATVLGYSTPPGSKETMVHVNIRRGPSTWEQALLPESRLRRIGKKSNKSAAQKYPTLFKEYQEKYKDAPIERLMAVQKRLRAEHDRLQQEAMDALHSGKNVPKDVYSDSERRNDAARLRRLAGKAMAAHGFVGGMIAERQRTDTEPPTIESRIRAEIDDQYAALTDQGIAPERSLFESTAGRVIGIAARQREAADKLVRDVSNYDARAQAIEALAATDPFVNAEVPTLEQMIERVSEAEYPSNEWQKIENELVEKLGPVTPDEWGGGMSFMGTGEFGRAIGRLILKNLPNALARTARAAGKAARYTYYDRQGNPVRRERLEKFMYDPYTDFYTMRVGAHTRLLGGDTVLVPELAGILRSDAAAADYFAGQAADAVVQALGIDGIAWAYRNKAEANRAVEGKPSKAPAWFMERIPALRSVLDEIHAMLTKRATVLGQEAPGYVENYIMRVVTGMRAGPAVDLIRLLDGNDISPSQIEERTDRLFAHRTGDPYYSEDLLDNLRRYFEYVAFRIGHDRFFRQLVDHIKNDPESTEGQQGGAHSRTALMMDWTRATFFRKQSQHEIDFNAGARRALFSKLAGGVRETSAEQAQAMSGKSAEQIKAMLAAKDPGGGAPDRYAVVEPGHEIAFLRGEPSEKEIQNARLAKAEGRGWEQPPAENSWVKVGTSKTGFDVYAGNRGYARDVSTPEPSAALKGALDMGRGLRLALGKAWAKTRGKAWDPAVEGALALYNQEKFLRRLHNDPANMITSFWTANNLRAVMGYNLSSATQNSGNFMLTAMPEYGLRVALQAVIAGGRAKALSNMRGVVDAFEGRGWFTPEQAKVIRRHLPVLVEEVFARAAASEQGEVHVAHADLDDIAAGRDPHLRKMLEGTVGPFAAFSFAEGMQRVLDATGAEIMGRRLGLDDKAIDAYREAIATGDEKARRKAYREMMGEVRDFSTRMSLIGTMSDMTQYHYGPRGRMWLFGTGPFSKPLTSLSTWPINNVFKQVARPAEGMVRTAAAAARGIAQAALPPGTIKDKPYRPPPGVTARSAYPRPRNWWTRMLEANGANWAHRHAAAVFLRHMMLSGLLTGLTRITNVNFARFGINPLFALGVALLALIFPKDELKKWARLAGYGSTLSLANPRYRGFVSVGPAVEAASEITGQASKNLYAGLTSSDARKAFPGGAKTAAAGAALGGTTGYVVGGKGGAAIGGAIGALAGGAAFESSLTQVRRQLLGFLRLGDVAGSRVAQEFPDFLKAHPWFAKALGIKSGMRVDSPGSVLRHQTGLMKEEERQRRKVVLPSNKPITRARLRQTFQPAY